MALAIRNGVETSHRVKAICEVWTYDVWGNVEDGWTVNDRSCAAREAELDGRCTVSCLPTAPGASDDYRTFPKSSSFSAELVVSFELTDDAIREALGTFEECDGDGETYYPQDGDGYPLGEIHILRWESVD